MVQSLEEALLWGKVHGQGRVAALLCPVRLNLDWWYTTMSLLPYLTLPKAPASLGWGAWLGENTPSVRPGSSAEPPKGAVKTQSSPW